MEKLVLALVIAKKELHHYFEAYPITIITDFSIKQIPSKLNLSGRLTNWAINLGLYIIKYIPKIAKKGQVLVDFLVET